MKNFKFLSVIFAMFSCILAFASPETEVKENIFDVEETDATHFVSLENESVDILYSKTDEGVLTHLFVQEDCRMICHFSTKTMLVNESMIDFVKSKFEHLPDANYYSATLCTNSAAIREKQKEYKFRQYHYEIPGWLSYNYNYRSKLKIT